MSLDHHTPAQSAIVDGVIAWCEAEGIWHTRTAIMLLSFGLRRAETVVCLDLGDTQVLVHEDRVMVRMPHRSVEFSYELDEAAKMITEVTEVLEKG